MLPKIEAFFMKEMKEKTGRLAILSLFLLVPFYPFRIFFLFLLCTHMLGWDVQHKRYSSLMALPYMPKQLFWLSYLFLVVISVETQLIGAALGDLAVAIEHVGSTAVPGLAAKPIIDLVVVIASRAQLPAVIAALARLGYIHEGDKGIPGREAFDRAGGKLGTGQPQDREARQMAQRISGLHVERPAPLDLLQARERHQMGHATSGE